MEQLPWLQRMEHKKAWPPEQLGSIGCHIQPPAMVKDGRTGGECCPPVCVIKSP
ncbi:hypothetical protein FQN60_015203 [Etheostoma spectabile]|uniref:Uncharacterized protein n=1 Tax=Etheostoma spectabile TaxID=54343 RepID=A0A5J5CUH8_9PERO|nr:hypothetical protein FQN60_015203 [Etheostoma spectabile]